MGEPSPVIELVQNPLAVPFDLFIKKFKAELEPVLLSQSGIISTITGAVISPDSNEPFAVSVTQWDSMDSHARFLNSPSAAPFFDKIKPLTRGPPTIEHYRFGIPPQTASGRSFAYLQKLDIKNDTEAANGNNGQCFKRDVYSTEGECIEHPGKKLVITFGNFEDMQSALKESKSGSSDSSFLVRFSSVESSKSVAML